MLRRCARRRTPHVSFRARRDPSARRARAAERSARAARDRPRHQCHRRAVPIPGSCAADRADRTDARIALRGNSRGPSLCPGSNASRHSCRPAPRRRSTRPAATIPSRADCRARTAQAPRRDSRRGTSARYRRPERHYIVAACADRDAPHRAWCGHSRQQPAGGAVCAQPPFAADEERRPLGATASERASSYRSSVSAIPSR